jgi:hypothetical protein
MHRKARRVGERNMGIFAKPTRDFITILSSNVDIFNIAPSG